MKKTTERKHGILQGCLKAQGCFAVSSLVLLLISCAIAYSLADPDSVTVPLSLSSLYLSAVIGGIAAVRFSEDGILSGTISGLMSTGILFCLSAMPLPDSTFSFPLSLFLTLAVIPASILGSILGHKRKNVKRGAKHKRK